MDLSQIIKFAKENAGRGYDFFDDVLWEKLFLKNKTIIVVENEQIKGFGVYREFDDKLFFVTVVLKKEAEKNWRAVGLMMKALERLPKKEIWWLDDRKGLKKWHHF